MAIQIPNPGTGNGATGDNEYVLWSKTRDNFTDQTNAASRLVGTENSNVPAYIGNTGLSSLGYGGHCPRLANATNLFSKAWVTGFYNGSNLVNAPLNIAGWFFIEAIAGSQANKVMLRLTHYVSGDIYVASGDNGVEASWSAWKRIADTDILNDQASAASKLVGTASGQIPLAQDLTKALYTPLQLAGALINVTDNLNDKIEGNVYYIDSSPQGASGFDYGVFWTEKLHNSARRVQYFKSVVSMTGHYVRQETVRDSQTYNSWVKYAFQGEDYTATSVKSGAASYKRGWRKLTASFGSGASTITRAHGVSNIAGVTVRATVSGVSYYANDARATHQFTIQTDGTNVIITKSVDATALNGAALTIYIDEEL